MPNTFDVVGCKAYGEDAQVGRYEVSELRALVGPQGTCNPVEAATHQHVVTPAIKGCVRTDCDRACASSSHANWDIVVGHRESRDSR